MRRFCSELFFNWNIEQTGPVHQLHAGATRLQYPVEDVPSRDDRTSRAVLESGNDESESGFRISRLVERVTVKNTENSRCSKTEPVLNS